LAAGMEGGGIELWDVAARKRLMILDHSALADALAYSPDGKMLAIGSPSSRSVSVKVWDVTSQSPQKVFEAPPGGCAVFSADGKLLAACKGRDVKVWRMPSGEPDASFESPDSSVSSIAFAADGNTLVLGCHDRTVKLWAFATGATRTVGVHLGPVHAVAFFPQGDLLASASGDGTVKLWHASPPQDSVGFARKSAIRSLAFTPDSKLLVVGSD